ncbi:MAG: 8-amino-7-oxononanoate synthase [Pseudomonadota bacterium]
MSDSLEHFARDKLADLEARHLRRTLIETDRTGPARAVRGPRRLISFSCNDYLNLTTDPFTKRRAVDAVVQFGVGAGASRLVTGNGPLYEELEAKLADLKGTEDAIVFGSGYLANISIAPTLVGVRDMVLIDELAHACLYAGARLSRARLFSFRHNDLAHVEELLKRFRSHHERAMILTDGVFSMDGDIAPLPGLAALAEDYDAWLMSDDAHGIGVVGEGRGSSFAFDPVPDVPLQMGTLSKAIGSYGGYLCASRAVTDLMRTRARGFIYTTGLPPAALAAASAALDVIATEPDRVALPVENARYFSAALDLPDPQSPIVPLIVGAPEAAMGLSRALEEAGFLVNAYRPPTVPEGTSRLRFAFSAAHRRSDIDRLLQVLVPLLRRTRDIA